MKSRLNFLTLSVFVALVFCCRSIVAGPTVVYFDTGLSPDGGYPSIWGQQTGTFTPLHDMLISLASSRFIPDSGAGGNIGSIEFFLNGTLIGQGLGNGFVNGQPTPAVFSQPLLLYSGVHYGIEVDTSGYLDLFHTSQISTPDGVISNIQAVDANGSHWVAFPSLQLAGPVPEPAISVLAATGFVGMLLWLRQSKKTALRHGAKRVGAQK